MRATLDRVRRNGDDGFTLIELLIVIIILGVLAAIVVFSVQGITDRGKTSACKTSISTVDTAFEAYYAQNGSAAALVDDLVPDFLHSIPTDINGQDATGKTNAEVDAFTC